MKKIFPASLRGKMKFFKRRDKKASGNGSTKTPTKSSLLGRRRSYDDSPTQHRFLPGGFPIPSPTRLSAQVLALFPAAVLERIFAFVCPHALDETYETQEQSSLFNDGCMLCALRDLAHCAQVCRQWRTPAVKLLYHSIRIDTVHYCDREDYLSDKRKRRTFFDCNGDPEDTPAARLKLLCRTLRDDPGRLAPLVQFLKLPYMLRESSQVDLARTIAVLPNLRYVDLPEGLFANDSACLALRLEAEARCRDLRKMTYKGGAEHSLEALTAGSTWPRLEVLELIKINLDPVSLRWVLGALANLKALKVTKVPAMSDAIFEPSKMLGQFPALEEFVLNEAPRVTIDGLQLYLDRPDTRRMLKVLTLNNTSVKPWSLQGILSLAFSLEHLSVSDEVTAAIPIAAGTHNIPPLQSKSLKTLNYEITNASSTSPYAGVTKSYYNYLSGSLLSGGLPNLRAVHVRDPSFPESLETLSAPSPGFVEGAFPRPVSSGSNSASLSGYPSLNGLGGGTVTPSPTSLLSPSYLPGQKPWTSAAGQGAQNPRFSSNNPFAALTGINQLPQTLEVYTKGDDDLDWSAVTVSADRPIAATSGRPSSGYGLGNEAWGAGAGARRSVFMGNGTGGFLAVPDTFDNGRSVNETGGTKTRGEEELWPRPKSSAGEKKRNNRDLWR